MLAIELLDEVKHFSGATLAKSVQDQIASSDKQRFRKRPATTSLALSTEEAAEHLEPREAVVFVRSLMQPMVARLGAEQQPVDTWQIERANYLERWQTVNQAGLIARED